MTEPTGQPQVLLLMGATATGKTDLAVALAQRFPVEIISVDSALIYRQMDIGTAKPDPQTLQQAPHHLIDILDPAQSWSAWDFVHSASQLIDDIHARGKLPLLVGGTMMYFNALQQGMNQLPASDDQLRQQLLQDLQAQGLPALYARLQSVDPAMAQRLKPTDTQRILRALEVYLISGQTLSQLQQQPAKPLGYAFTRIILEVPERAELHQRIALRFRQMIERGFEQEVAKLMARGDLNPELPSMRCVGYRQMWSYLSGQCSHPMMVEKSIVATRQLAKRQITWLRKYPQALRLNYNKASLSDVCQYTGLE